MHGVWVDQSVLLGKGVIILDSLTHTIIITNSQLRILLLLLQL